MTFQSLSMVLETAIVTFSFVALVMGVDICLMIGKKQGGQKLALHILATVIVAAIMLLYVSTITAERAVAPIPKVSAWFASLPVYWVLPVILAAVVLFVHAIRVEIKRRRSVITVSSIKESLDHLKMGLCFCDRRGFVLLTNFRMNELSHAIFSKPIQNGMRFWEVLMQEEPTGESCERMALGENPEFKLADETVWSFRLEKLSGIYQITAAETTRQHQLIDALRIQNRELEEMNTGIREYGDKVDKYVIARERLETRVNLHGFLGQALLMTRHYLKYQTGDVKKIMDIWKRNIDVLRLEAEPQTETDSFTSLVNAAQAIGMQVHITGKLPDDMLIRRLMASMGAETLTNAVRHAGARQLWICVEESEQEYIIHYTNDGEAPQRPVSEGGGLSTARRKIEAAGGRKQIESSPRFRLTLFFGKERMSVV